MIWLLKCQDTIVKERIDEMKSALPNRYRERKHKTCSLRFENHRRSIGLCLSFKNKNSNQSSWHKHFFFSYLIQSSVLSRANHVSHIMWQPLAITCIAIFQGEIIGEMRSHCHCIQFVAEKLSHLCWEGEKKPFIAIIIRNFSPK